MNNSGVFITFEGPEGAGKTTQIARVSEELYRQGIIHTTVREPGGTEVGNRIRALLLDPELDGISAKAEMLLFAAARAQLIAEVIQPGLQQGNIVLCDRYIDSSIAYQGYGAQGKQEDIILINQIATNQCLPDRTYLLDLPLEAGRQRLAKRGASLDRQEAKVDAFHERVRQGYLDLAKKDSTRFCILDATQSEDQVFKKLIADLSSIIK